MFTDSNNSEKSLNELTALAEAAGAEVVGFSVQNRQSICAATYIGSGKLEEVARAVSIEEANLVIFNNELSGSQLRNIEEVVGTRIIDRTMLILDIFAIRAKTKIAKLQVSLAQEKYKLPRLIGFGGELSRTGSSGGGGGVRVGTRGAGEQKLELDRRAIKRRITEFERQIAQAEASRKTQSARRKKNHMPIVAIVGYTNSGKSSLMNHFIEEGGDEEKKVFEKDMLFATLDTYNRSVELNNKSKIILTDTVGFVSNLPHGLVRAFRSTLEEAASADLLIEVVDLSNPDYAFQESVTKETLNLIGASNIPVIKAYNKIDLTDERPILDQDSVFICAKTGENISQLVEMIEHELFSNRVKVKLEIPFSKGDISSNLQEKYDVEIDYTQMGYELIAELEPEDAKRLSQYIKEIC